MMKRMICGVIVFLFLMMILPAYAVEHDLGGYWRVRMFTNQNFSGTDEGIHDEALDLSWTDTRVRLFYTATINERLKIVNKFEMDAIFGSDEDDQYGDVGADGVAIEVKNSYADIDLDPVHVKLGVHDATIARGFLFDDDFAGATLTYKRDQFTIPFYWIKVFEGGQGRDKNEQDFDCYAVSPVFTAGGLRVNPFLFIGRTSDWKYDILIDDALLFYLGGEVSGTAGPLSLTATGIFENGSMDGSDLGRDKDVTAFLFAVKGTTEFQGFDIHGEFFYASGDDNSGDDEENKFSVPAGQSYYWAEIMGYGLFDYDVSNGSPADQIGNIMAFNIGASFKPMPKLTVGADLWYASLAEEDGAGDNVLGTELDLSLKYEVMKDLTLDAVAAFLLPGDATNPDPGNDGDVMPYEVGVQLSVRF